jgi:hypothetical protein
MPCLLMLALALLLLGLHMGLTHSPGLVLTHRAAGPVGVLHRVVVLELHTAVLGHRTVAVLVLRHSLVHLRVLGQHSASPAVLQVVRHTAAVLEGAGPLQVQHHPELREHLQDP